jgi:hypothetical protein
LLKLGFELEPSPGTFFEFEPGPSPLLFSAANEIMLRCGSESTTAACGAACGSEATTPTDLSSLDPW